MMIPFLLQLRKYRFFKSGWFILLGVGLFAACQRSDEEPWFPPRVTRPAVTYLFWTDVQTAAIMRATLHDTSLLTVDTLYNKTDGVKSPHGLAVDATRQQLYWAEYAANRIQRADWSGQGAPETVYAATDSVHAPVALTLSPQQRQLYWTEPTRNQIQTALLDGNELPRILYDARHGVDGPFGIACTATYLYWVEPADNQVVRARLAGPGAPVILYSGTHELAEPFGLALDTVTNELNILDNPLPYLTPSDRQDRIFRGRLTGSGALTPLFTSGRSVQNAYSLAIDRRHGKLYWLNQLDPSVIMQGNLDGSGTPRELIRLNSIGFALAVYSSR